MKTRLSRSIKHNFIPFCILLVVSAFYVMPMLKNIMSWGAMDWDQFTFWHAVPRDTILRYWQLPLWNPYSNGGNVLLAHTHSSFLSPFFIIIILCGPILGLKLGVILHLLIGMLGMLLLSRDIGISKRSSYLPPLVYMCSSIYFLHLAEGHIEWMAMAFIPWLFLFYLKSLKEPKHIISCIFILLLMLLGGSVYIFSITIIILFVYALMKLLQKKRFIALRNIILIITGAFLLCSIKILPMLEFLNDNPRIIKSSESTQISLLPTIFLSKNQALYYQNTKWTSPERKLTYKGSDFEYGWHEYGAYIGFIPLVLIAVGILFYLRQYWPLFITGVLSLWISLGKGAFYNFWGLIHKLPLYNSLHVPSRFIVMSVFCMSLFSGLGLTKLERLSVRKPYKFLITAIIGFVFIDLYLINYQVLKDTFPIKPPAINRYVEFKQRHRDFSLLGKKSRSSMYPALLSNSGVINSYDIATVKKGDVKIVGEQGYKGEVYLVKDTGSVIVNSFSPNSVTVDVSLEEPSRLAVNQNYYKGWKVKGVTGKISPYKGLISVRLPKGSYRVTLYYLPNSFIIGAVISMITFMSLIFLLTRPSRHR